MALKKLKAICARSCPAPVLLTWRYFWRTKADFDFWLRDGYSLKSYSIQGEDLILDRAMGYKKNGFFVDIGANHPKRFSNTYFFYKQGWRGINIDPLPGTAAVFNRARPRDINIEEAIGTGRQLFTYYMFNDSALNSFDENLSLSRPNRYQIIERRTMTLKPLSEILQQHLPPGQKIDFFNIDVEGLDLDVLRSNDFVRFRPEFVLVECLALKMNELESNEVFRFLREQGYRAIAVCLATVVFQSEGLSQG